MEFQKASLKIDWTIYKWIIDFFWDILYNNLYIFNMKNLS